MFNYFWCNFLWVLNPILTFQSPDGDNREIAQDIWKGLLRKVELKG